MPSSPTLERERQKRSHTKARSGCSTCKARRIKCGEEKPICLRCQIGRRECSYSVPKQWVFEPQKSPPRSSLQLQPPPSPFSGTSDERRSFEFFREKTATQFAGQHDVGQRFFSFFIPQSAMAHPTIFKLAVAMGARHEANILGSTKAAELASNSHSLVISNMARNLTQMKTELTLLCCTLLMAYANLCEEVPATAAIHFSLGLKMLRDSAASTHEPESHGIDSYIGPMFAELEIATAVFAVPPPEVEIIPKTPRYPPQMPRELVDLRHAKNCLFDIIGWYVYIMVVYKSSLFELAARTAEVDDFLSRWRQMLVDLSLRLAVHYPGLYMKARKMLFQYKLFHMCKAAARNTMFVDSCQVEMTSVDFTYPHIVSIICLVKNDADKGSWPLRVQSSRRGAEDDLDIWPEGELVGTQGSRKAVRIVLGR